VLHVFCQVCGKVGHPAFNCFKRFDANFAGPPQKSASAATSGYGVDTNWYMDSDAMDHITSELDRLSYRDKYHDGDHVHAANGSGMEISHVGHSIVQSPPHKIHLCNVLHVPDASKHLVSVNRLTRDNNAFVEFHPDHFAIKEAVTMRTLLRGRAEGGLYPIKFLPSSSPPNKQALGVVKPSSSIWHSRLGHPSAPVVSQVLSRHQLSFIQDVNNKRICDACQQGKSHQLPYPKSTSVSRSPLDLVFSDVWGPAPQSVGRFAYYVSFIDDYSNLFGSI
jgi:histone deacetylase 1/2